jgi:hypothetical protein
MHGFDPTHLLGPLLVAMLFLLLFGSRVDKGRAKETPEGLVFALKPIYSLARLLGLPIYIGFFFWLSWRQNHMIPWPVLVLCVLAYAFSLIQAPATITLTPMAITQSFWMQRLKIIPYGEVMTLQAIQAGRTIIIVGDNRTRIRHSSNHAAAAEFRREIERRTGKRILN